MAETLSVDICVIGGGSGGLTVAAAAAAFGVSTVLVEGGLMGGDCLNYGCVPSKALIAAARHIRLVGDAAAFGIDAGPATVDFARVQAHVHAAIAAIAPNDTVERFTALGVRVVRAQARFLDRRTVEAGDVRIRARRFVVATGARPDVPAIPGLETVDYLTNETVFALKALPAHLAVIGAGPVGIELAQAFRRLGAVVTVIDKGRALAGFDEEIAAFALGRLRAEGVDVREHLPVSSVERLDDGIRLSCGDGERAVSFDCSHVLVATGRSPNVAELGLAAAGIRFSPAGIAVGAGLRTSNRRVYAIGDVTGGPQYTHAANYHAKVVLPQLLLRLRSRVRPQIIPQVLFSDPEVAQIGLGAEAAKRRHGEILILRWPYSENDRAQTECRTTGLIRVIADRKARILGVAIAGEGAAEMINIWALAMASGLTLKDMRSYVPPYPTFSEIGKRAAVTYYMPFTRTRWIRSVIRFLARFG